jgi:hypothetical protein
MCAQGPMWARSSCRTSSPTTTIAPSARLAPRGSPASGDPTSLRWAADALHCTAVHALAQGKEVAEQPLSTTSFGLDGTAWLRVALAWHLGRSATINGPRCSLLLTTVSCSSMCRSVPGPDCCHQMAAVRYSHSPCTCWTVLYLEKPSLDPTIRNACSLWRRQ